MKILKIIGVFMIGIIIGYFIFHKEDSNANLEYGQTGAPKNCKAIIYENYFAYKISEKITAEDALTSIYRNCGENGPAWEN
ncbi:MAG TPA: hypothetical protein VMX18_02175 [Candidatus Bipolaricaulota bacterium]|nr:hypothetical protein [Candidatus Bipolaricaulota bacterium]